MEKVKFRLKKPLSSTRIEFITETLRDSSISTRLDFHDNHIEYLSQNEEELDDLNELLEKLVFISRAVERKRVIVSRTPTLQFLGDPLKSLIDMEEVVKIGEGLFLFQGQFLKVFKAIDEYLLNIAINEFDAVEQENPILWPMELFRKVNYLEEFPQQALMVSGLRKERNELKNFARQHSSKHDFFSISSKKHLADAEVGLQPAVCDTCYFSLKGRSDIQNVNYTTKNKVFRNEISEHASLDRLMAFTVRDLIFIGDRNYTLLQRENLIERLIKFFDDTGLNYSIEVADDPFFSGNIEKKYFQHQFELKYEVLATIPFLGKRIAIGSINLHLDTFSSSLDIKQGCDFVHSGCVGIGYERLLLALYSQHGTDLSTWPSSLLKILNLKC